MAKRPRRPDCCVGMPDARCGKESVVGWITCADHWRSNNDEWIRSVRYGFAAVAYYGNEESPWTNGEFDELCSILLADGTYDRVAFVEKELLQAGSGYDMKAFPEWIHQLVGEHIGRPCACTACQEKRNG